MIRTRSPLTAFLVLVACVPAALARKASADLTGAYDGQFAITKPAAATAPVGAALSQSTKTLSGTVAVTTADPLLSGAYLGRGTTNGKGFKFTATTPTGAKLTWRGKVTTDGASGKARLKNGKTRAVGTLTLTRKPTAGGGGASCDAVFQANQAFFVDQVMGTVLQPICSACHVAGGLAEATRLRVDPADPLATARTVALLVDPTNPSASLIVNKPTARLPHGGGQQVTPGSAQEQTLLQWATLVAQAQCSSGGPTDHTPAGLFANTCASCHGADAAGLNGRPDIRCTVRSRILDAVRRGRGNGQMPAFSTTALPDADLDAIIGYLGGLCSGTPAARFASNCVTCHGPTGGGGQNADGVVGPNMRCQNTADFVEKVSQGGEGMPAFPELSTTDITAIASYVQTTFCPLGG